MEDTENSLLKVFSFIITNLAIKIDEINHNKYKMNFQMHFCLKYIGVTFLFFVPRGTLVLTGQISVNSLTSY